MRQLVITSLFAAVLSLAGCGAPGGGADSGSADSGAGAGAAGAGPATGPSAEEVEHYRQFARCMREHGVPLADPDPGGGFGSVGPRDPDPVVRAAFEACRRLLPNGGQPKQISPEELEQARAFSRCMREHGVPYPDPDPDGSVKIDGSTHDAIEQKAAEAAPVCQAAVRDGDK